MFVTSFSACFHLTNCLRKASFSAKPHSSLAEEVGIKKSKVEI